MTKVVVSSFSRIIALAADDRTDRIFLLQLFPSTASAVTSGYSAEIALHAAPLAPIQSNIPLEVGRCSRYALLCGIYLLSRFGNGSNGDGHGGISDHVLVCFNLFCNGSLISSRIAKEFEHVYALFRLNLRPEGAGFLKHAHYRSHRSALRVKESRWMRLS